MAAAVSNGGDGHAVARQPIFLLDCLVDTALLASSAAGTQLLLTTLHGIFQRMSAYPDVEKYKRINMDSATWRTKVAPHVYPLRLAEWGGFLVLGPGEWSGSGEGGNEEVEELVEERSREKESGPHRLVSSARPRAPPRESIHGFVGRNELVNVLGEAEVQLRLFELDQVRRRHLPLQLQCEAAAPELLAVEKECQRLLWELAATVPRLADWEQAKRLVYLALLRSCLPSGAGVARERGGEEEMEAEASPADRCAHRLASALDITLSAMESLSPATTQRQATLLAFFRSHADAVTLVMLSDCLTLVDTQRSHHGGGSGSSALPATTTTTLTPQERRGLRDAVAARFKEQQRREARQQYLDSTGEAYRALSAEEQGAGVTRILDIASAMEQVAILEETQGLVHTSRREADRLHKKFKQDGDLVYLQGLADAWEAKLEEAKLRTGRPTVFL